MGSFASGAPIDRDTVLHTLVTVGGALLLAYAMFGWATERASPQQLRGLVAAGLGFLMTAGASLYLRQRTVIGPIVSLAGTVVAMGGMLTLVRERRDRALRYGAKRDPRSPLG